MNESDAETHSIRTSSNHFHQEKTLSVYLYCHLLFVKVFPQAEDCRMVAFKKYEQGYNGCKSCFNLHVFDNEEDRHFIPTIYIPL